MSVYFVTCRDANAVKIGHSGDPRIRARDIQIGCPLPVTLEAVIPGGFEVERALHGQFADHRMCGEWFAITPVIEDMIAANRAPAEAPRADIHYRAPQNERTLVARTRAHLRITQRDMAALVGMSVDDLGKYERGRRLGKYSSVPLDLEQKLLALVREMAA